MQVIAGFFGSRAFAALPAHRAVSSPSFKELARFAKLATSYMPDLDGPALYARLLHQYTYHSQRVIFLTGDTLSADSTAFLAQCAQPWLPKPCNAEAIRRAIQQVLQAVALRPARMEARKALPTLPPAE